MLAAAFMLQIRLKGSKGLVSTPSLLKSQSIQYQLSTLLSRLPQLHFEFL
jgi:hypothetical protein